MLFIGLPACLPACLPMASECRRVRIDVGAVAVGLEAPAARIAARLLTASAVEDDHRLAFMYATLCQPRSGREGDTTEGDILVPWRKHDPVERPGEREVVLCCSGVRAEVWFDDHERCPFGVGRRQV